MDRIAFFLHGQRNVPTQSAEAGLPANVVRMREVATGSPANEILRV